jgi:transcriptional regulator GlxA family with amidase domain
MSIQNESQETAIETTSHHGPTAPLASGSIPAGSPDSAVAGLGRVVELVLERHAEPLTMRDLTAAAGMPANSLTRAFNRLYGISPKRWVWYFRTVLAAELIANAPAEPLSAAWSRCGFVSAAHFSRRFREVYREAPTTWRARLLATGVRLRPGLADKPQFRRFTQEAEEAAARALARLGKG